MSITMGAVHGLPNFKQWGNSNMPCRDDRDEPGYGRGYAQGQATARDAEKQIKLLEAMLCAMITVVDEAKLSHKIDYKEGGFTNAQLQHWWAEHQRKDTQRREKEAKVAQAKAEKARILSKLTPQERKKLGL